MSATADKYLGQLLASENRIKQLEAGLEAVVKIFTEQYGIVACEAVCDNMVRHARGILSSPATEIICVEHVWDTVGIPQGAYQCRKCKEIG